MHLPLQTFAKLGCSVHSNNTVYSFDCVHYRERMQNIYQSDFHSVSVTRLGHICVSISEQNPTIKLSLLIKFYTIKQKNVTNAR